MDENTGEMREEVGPGKPPMAHRFSSTNQPKNRKGGRNGYHLKPLLKKLLATVNESDPKRRTYAEAFIEAEFVRALKKGGDSARRIWEYVEGKPEQPINLGNSDGGDLFATLADALRKESNGGTNTGGDGSGTGEVAD